MIRKYVQRINRATYPTQLRLYELQGRGEKILGYALELGTKLAVIVMIPGSIPAYMLYRKLNNKARKEREKESNLKGILEDKL